MSPICVMIFGVGIELEAISRALGQDRADPKFTAYFRLRKWPHNFSYGLHATNGRSRVTHGPTMNRHVLEPPWLCHFQWGSDEFHTPAIGAKTCASRPRLLLATHFTLLTPVQNTIAHNYITVNNGSRILEGFSFLSLLSNC